MEMSLHHTVGVSSYYSNPEKKTLVMILRTEECHAPNQDTHADFKNSSTSVTCRFMALSPQHWWLLLFPWQERSMAVSYNHLLWWNKWEAKIPHSRLANAGRREPLKPISQCPTFRICNTSQAPFATQGYFFINYISHLRFLPRKLTPWSFIIPILPSRSKQLYAVDTQLLIYTKPS